MSTRLAAGIVAAAAIGIAMPTAAAEPPARADIAQLVAAAGERPSLDADRAALDDTLRAAGLDTGAIARLCRGAEFVVSGNGLADLLRLTRDPERLRIRDLFAEFLTIPGGEPLTKPHSKQLQGFAGMVSFPDIVALDVKTARSLRPLGRAEWSAALELPRVGELAPDVAAELAKYRGMLCLPGLRGLSAKAAAALARPPRSALVIGGFPTLEADAARALARLPPESHLILPDLESLDSEDLAHRLAIEDVVFLPSLRSLTPRMADALRSEGGGGLILPGLEELSVDVARRLVEANSYRLALDGGAMLTPDAAATLAEHVGELMLTGTVCPTESVARRLRDAKATLVLRDVPHLPDDVVAAFAGREQTLVLPGITRLDARQASQLARLGKLVLPEVTTIDVAAAESLAGHDDELFLPGLRKLPPPVARALSAHRGPLHLDGLVALDSRAAEALADCPGDLALDGLVAVDRGTAAALLARTRPLSLNGLQAVERIDSVELARLLAVHSGHDLSLYAVTSIDGPDAVAIAVALAEAPRPLALPSLERITSRALTALLRKRDVELPPVTELKVVPDPGGGTDDFVDPR
jgi:hypothetical protein